MSLPSGGTGLVSALTDTGYNVEVTGGDFYMGETVGIYRESSYAAESRIGRGTVGRTAPVAVCVTVTVTPGSTAPLARPMASRRAVSIARHADGSLTARIELDAVGGEKFCTALEALVQAGRAAGDLRTRAQQLGDALVQLCDNALAGCRCCAR